MTWMGPRLPWHDRIAHRPDYWFGRTFWFGVIVCTFIVPGLETFWLCAADLPSIEAIPLALVNIIVACILYSLAWGLTSFGTHYLTTPVRLFNILKRVYPIEYDEIRSAGRQYRLQLNKSQKDNLIEEQVETPLSYKIFTKYIWRVSFVVLTIPLYVGVALLSLREVPGVHMVPKHGGFVEGVHALEVFRDIQMAMLGGSSTEHLLVARNEFATVAQSADKGRRSLGIAGQQKNVSPLVVTLKEAYFGSESWRPFVWELIGMFCTFVYVSVALILCRCSSAL